MLMDLYADGLAWVWACMQISLHVDGRVRWDHPLTLCCHPSMLWPSIDIAWPSVATVAIR